MRQRRQQKTHDVVIEKLVAMLSDKHGANNVHANPGNQKHLEVDGHWPDVVRVDKDGEVQAIFEVETEGTVAMSHAEKQWVAYAELGVSFFLVVPEESRHEAKRIVRELGLAPQLEGLMLY